MKNLEIGDKFCFVNPWNGFSKETVFVFCGITDVFVCGPNVFDICLEHKEEELFFVEDQEVTAC